MYCPNCGARNERDAASCVNCGAALKPADAPTESVSTESSSGAPPPPAPPAPTTTTSSSSQDSYAQPTGSQPGTEQPSSGDQPSYGGADYSQPSAAPPPPSYGEQRNYGPTSGSMGGGGSTGSGNYARPASGGVGTQVPNRLVAAIVWTVVSFILAFFTFGITGIGVITGIIAIIFAAQVNGKVAAGDISGAQQASRTVRVLNLVTLGIVVLGVIVGIILIVIFVLALSAQGV